METNILYTEQEIADAQASGSADHFEVSRERIRIGTLCRHPEWHVVRLCGISGFLTGRIIGRGAFGCIVYRGTADSINGIAGPTTVAVKQLNSKAGAAMTARANLRVVAGGCIDNY